MYDDSWYSYVPELTKGENSSQDIKQRRRDSLLKQSGGNAQVADHSKSFEDKLELVPGLGRPLTPTLAKRAKSYSDFYEIAVACLANGVKSHKTNDVFEEIRSWKNSAEDQSDEFEYDLLEQNHADYQLYQDQLALSERHLENLLHGTASALDLLATLSECFKKVESETRAFEGQCEDLLAEQQRLRDLANQVGTDLQYYAYLEPSARRLTAPGAGHLVSGDDYLDMLTNLNSCIDFMDRHPTYRDSSLYKTRYVSLLEKALNLVQTTFSSAFQEVTDEVVRNLRSKDHNETSEYILLYGKYEHIQTKLGSPIQRILKSTDFAFGKKGDDHLSGSYILRYHELWSQLVDIYIRNREPVTGVVTKNIKKFIASEKPDTDFQSFARHSVQYVIDICHNEQALLRKFFQNGPLFVEYGLLTGWNKSSNYAQILEENTLSYLGTLYNFISPYFGNSDLQRIYGLVNWLETMYLASTDGELDMETSRSNQASIGRALMERYLWKALDELSLKAAMENGAFKPSQDDLQVATNVTVSSNKSRKSNNGQVGLEDIDTYDKNQVSNAYPTVRTAVKLLVIYNDGFAERPRTSDVLYEIVHQATESLQKAATIIKRTSGMMDAQLFLIKNLMLIENLFMTHEIPDSVRQSAEFDFTPIWHTIADLQAQKQLFNPLAYITPLVRGRMLPAVIDRVLDARKELERVLVQQITAFTKTWQSRLAERELEKREAARRELEVLLRKAFDDETTRVALWKMIRAEK